MRMSPGKNDLDLIPPSPDGGTLRGPRKAASGTIEEPDSLRRHKSKNGEKEAPMRGYYYDQQAGAPSPPPRTPPPPRRPGRRRAAWRPSC